MRVCYYKNMWDEPDRINGIHDVLVQQDGQVVVTTMQWQRIVLRPQIDFISFWVDNYDEKKN